MEYIYVFLTFQFRLAMTNYICRPRFMTSTAQLMIAGGMICVEVILTPSFDFYDLSRIAVLLYLQNPCLQLGAIVASILLVPPVPMLHYPSVTRSESFSSFGSSSYLSPLFSLSSVSSLAFLSSLYTLSYLPLSSLLLPSLLSLLLPSLSILCPQGQVGLPHGLVWDGDPPWPRPYPARCLHLLCSCYTVSTARCYQQRRKV